MERALCSMYSMFSTHILHEIKHQMYRSSSRFEVVRTFFADFPKRAAKPLSQSLRVVPNEAIISFFTENFRNFPKYFREKPTFFTPEKAGLQVLQFFLGKKLKFRYKGVEDWAAARLELCHHSRAHETEQGRSQGHWQVMADRRRRSEFLSSRRRLDKVIAPRRPTERAR